MGIFETMSSLQERITGGWPGGQSQAGAATQARAAAQAGMTAATQAGGGESRQLAAVVSEVVASMRQMVEAQRAFSASLKTATEGLRGLGGATGASGGQGFSGGGGWGGSSSLQAAHQRELNSDWSYQLRKNGGNATAPSGKGFGGTGGGGGGDDYSLMGDAFRTMVGTAFVSGHFMSGVGRSAASYASSIHGPASGISDESRFLSRSREGAGRIEALKNAPIVGGFFGSAIDSSVAYHGGADFAAFKARGAIAGFGAGTSSMIAGASGDPLKMIENSRREQLIAARLESERLPAREQAIMLAQREGAINYSASRQSENARLQQNTAYAISRVNSTSMLLSATANPFQQINAQSDASIQTIRFQRDLELTQHRGSPEMQFNIAKNARMQENAVRAQQEYQTKNASMSILMQRRTYDLETQGMLANAEGTPHAAIAARRNQKMAQAEMQLERQLHLADGQRDLIEGANEEYQKRASAINLESRRESFVERESFRAGIASSLSASKVNKLSQTRDRRMQIEAQSQYEQETINTRERMALIDAGGQQGPGGQIIANGGRFDEIRKGFAAEREASNAKRDFQSSEYKRELSQSVTASIENSQTRIRLGLAQFEFERAEVVAGSKKRQLALEFGNLPKNEQEVRSKQYATELRAIEFERMAAIRASGVGIGVSTSGEVATREAMDPAKIEAGLDKIADNTKPLEGFVPALNRLTEVMQKKQAAVFVQ